MIQPRIRQNPFETYEEVAEGFEDLLAPLELFFDREYQGHLDLGTHGTVYSKGTRDAEAFLRPLWGLGPYVTQNESEYLNEFLTGIIEGTDPESSSYWGKTKDYDQLIVEMAALSTFLLLNKEKTWDQLTKEQQNNLHSWLIQANENIIPPNNWHFFRVLLNLAMKHCEMPYSKEQIAVDLAVIDRFYVGNGWYYDGVETQVDYYVSFAIHYYSLLYCRFAPEDTARVAIMKERATLFAQEFKYWFTQPGEAIPFGRSLTYRFAQVSFFSALVFADVEALPWGEIKGLISRHLHQWMNKDIFTTDGLLSVGYDYQNMVFAEGYNGPGSPYWAFKTFILLAVPKDHPYWQAETQPISFPEKHLPSPESRNYYQVNDAGTHGLMFPAGQFINYQAHAHDKYSKFVYSSHFGFSTIKSDYWYYEGAYDNCLALAEDDHYFRTKGLDDQYEILDDRIIHQWHPWSDVAIKTTIVPLEGQHLRIHEIETQRALVAYEGGFSIPLFDEKVTCVSDQMAEVKNAKGVSKVENINGFSEAAIIRTEPNTNLLYPLTELPYLKVNLSKGKHLLISLVTGVLPNEQIEPVKVRLKENQLLVEEKVVILGN